MSTAREPNPLRPYYIPPSVGLPPESISGTSGTPSSGAKYASSGSTASPSVGSSARNLLSDLNYSEYLSDSSPSAKDLVKRLVDQLLWKYTSVLLAQPFEVAKTVLQVHHGEEGRNINAQRSTTENMRRRPDEYRDSKYEISSDDSDPDSPSYFTSAAPLSHTPSQPPRRRRHREQPSPYSAQDTPSAQPTSRASPHSLKLHSPSSLTGVLSSLWTNEGAWGLWKGTNSTYFHSVLLSTLTSFARSFLCAILSLPDPGLSLHQSLPVAYTAGGLDVLSSPSPFASLLVAVSAAGIAGMILAPLDMARTKIMLTPSTHPPRSILPVLRSLPSWTLPFSIAPVTILHSTLPTIISASTPLLLRTRFGIDSLLTPNVYAFATCISQVFELGVRLPIETVLRRGQMAVACAGDTHTVVEVGPYKGLVGTMYSVVREEGEQGRKGDLVKGTHGAPAIHVSKQGKTKKGQGLEGLWRGWRVGMWGLVGVWGAATLGGVGGKGGEF